MNQDLYFSNFSALVV